MKKLPFILLAVITLVLAITTILESMWGSAWAGGSVYGSAWFASMWGVMAVAATFLIAKKKLWKRLSVFMLHLSFLVILAGALTTHIFSKGGTLYLRNDSYTNEKFVQGFHVPFDISLDSFEVKYYDGTEAPMDYISHVQIDGKAYTVSMNNIASVKGYRFYQTSYDPDFEGTYLTVSYDPYGISITHLGYLMLLVSILAFLFEPKGRFITLFKTLMNQKTACLMLMLLSAPMARAAVSTAEVDSLARTLVIYNNRIMPLNTMARDFCTKLYGKPQYHNLSSEQVLMGWLLQPEAWADERMIYDKKSKAYLTLNELFPAGQYQSRSREIDEKVGLILMLREGTLYKDFPKDGSVVAPSAFKVKTELLYNKLPLTKVLFMFCLTFGLIAFIAHLASLLWGWEKTWLKILFVLALVIALLGVLSGFIMRWIIMGSIPLSNGYETMQFVALSVLVVSLLIMRRFEMILPFGLLIAGFTLLVSYLGQMNPQITPLMPVLHSPWLSSHVSSIMVSYALFAIITLDALLALGLMCSKKYEAQVARITLFSRFLLYPAVSFLTIGIFFGAVWANVSWGRYWGWDPKEVWALITMIVYGIAFHGESLPIFRSPKAFHAYMIFAFLTVLMTYFGVNYVLGGMHSYANV